MERRKEAALYEARGAVGRIQHRCVDEGRNQIRRHGGKGAGKQILCSWYFNCVVLADGRIGDWRVQRGALQPEKSRATPSWHLPSRGWHCSGTVGARIIFNT